MSRHWSHPNFYQAELIVSELMRHGVEMFFVAPGSRSTPLALAISALADNKSIVHFDERGLAFAALGFARAARTPAALVCTSGTAVANFLPAVVESSMSAVPLIILTADRPAELHNRGANQTISQRRIFGEFVRHEFELEVPSASLQPQMVRDTIEAAYLASIRVPAGPVHINCPYREPLSQTADEYTPPSQPEAKMGVKVSQAIKTPHVPSERDRDWLTSRMRESHAGMIVVGRLDSQQEAHAVAKFANTCDWPVAADVTSQLRLSYGCKHLCEHFDLLLLNDSLAERCQPDLVLHVGGEIVSKRIQEWFQKTRPAEFVHISSDPRHRDPSFSVTKHLTTNLCQLADLSAMPNAASSKLAMIHESNIKIREYLAGRFDSDTHLTEVGVARKVVSLSPKDSALFLSSSLPIRLVDMYASSVTKSILVGANRGASGIDGVIASAVGYARGTNSATTLLIGDLAFFHDLNSLALLRETSAPFVVVLLNNDGGGIFHLLPISQDNPSFEKYWGTPHGLNPRFAAEMFGLGYNCPATMGEFCESFSEAHKSKMPALIEVKTVRESTSQLIRTLQKEIQSLIG